MYLRSLIGLLIGSRVSPLLPSHFQTSASATLHILGGSVMDDGSDYRQRKMLLLSQKSK